MVPVAKVACRIWQVHLLQHGVLSNCRITPGASIEFVSVSCFLLDTITNYLRDDELWEFLFCEDPVIVEDTKEELQQSYLKDNLERKEMRGKTGDVKQQRARECHHIGKWQKT